MKKVLSFLYILNLCLICFHPTNAQSADDETSAPQIREIVFDLETTGFDYKNGDKIIEIGAVELINHIPTGRTYQQYVNPMRDSNPQAFEKHGLSREFLSQYPTFPEIAQGFLDFIGEDSVLIAHNGKKFDLPFINYELKQNGFKTLENHRIVDTLIIARDKLYKLKSKDLDSLFIYFDVDSSKRVKHGALIDSELLAEVYLKLVDPRVEEMVRDAIKNHKKLQITYQKNPKYNKEVTTRVIVPKRLEYGSVFMSENPAESYKLQNDELYLKAFCELRGEDRTFLLYRILEIAPAE